MIPENRTSTGGVDARGLPPALNVDPFTDELLTDLPRWHQLLRDGGSVVYLPKYNCYAVGGFAEVTAGMADHENLISSAGIGLYDVRKGEHLRPPGPIVESDPPDHTQLRDLLKKILSPRVTRGWRDGYEEEADRLVAEIIDKGEIDAVTELSEPYVLKVLPDTLGIDDVARENILIVGDATGNSFGPLNDRFIESQKRLDVIMPWLNTRFERETMVGFGKAVWDAVDTGEIAEETVRPLLRTFLRGGNDTTFSGLGSELMYLANNPDQWDILRADPSTIMLNNAFSEALRMQTPIQYLFRTTNKRMQFGGHVLEDNMKILFNMGAANGDPRKWENPNRFDVRRITAGHTAFGVGIHNCVGQNISRLMSQVLFLKLIEKVERLEPTTPHVWQLTNGTRKLAKLPLRVIPK